jgi:hypothetical protein
VEQLRGGKCAFQVGEALKCVSPVVLELPVDVTMPGLLVGRPAIEAADGGDEIVPSRLV